MTDSQTEERASSPLKQLVVPLFLLGGLPLVAHLARPDLPETWERVHLDLTRTEVVALTGAVFVSEHFGMMRSERPIEPAGAM